MANPVNKELPVKLKEEVGVLETDRVTEESKPETGAVYIKEEETNKPASWETAKREKLYALILSVVLGIFGADWFYLCVTSTTYIVVGVIKLVFCGIGGVLCGFAACTCDINFKNFKDLVALLAGLVIFAWWIGDWVRILLDAFPDGMGRPLLPFSYTIP